MREGWTGDDYLVLFSGAEIANASARYRIDQFLPGFLVVGLKGWDDLIVRDDALNTYTVPTVPLSAKFLGHFSIPPDVPLEPDTRLAGKIKWYIKPIAFGGTRVSVRMSDGSRTSSTRTWWSGGTVFMVTFRIKCAWPRHAD